MKWNDDEYKDLKLAIFDCVRALLNDEDAKKLNVRCLVNSIDTFINLITVAVEKRE